MEIDEEKVEDETSKSEFEDSEQMMKKARFQLTLMKKLNQIK